MDERRRAVVVMMVLELMMAALLEMVMVERMRANEKMLELLLLPSPRHHHRYILHLINCPRKSQPYLTLSTGCGEWWSEKIPLELLECELRQRELAADLTLAVTEAPPDLGVIM